MRTGNDRDLTSLGAGLLIENLQSNNLLPIRPEKGKVHFSPILVFLQHDLDYREQGSVSAGWREEKQIIIAAHQHQHQHHPPAHPPGPMITVIWALIIGEAGGAELKPDSWW